MSVTQQSASDYAVPLNINKLEGRLLRYPNSRNRNREILCVYGLHSSIERWWRLVEVLHGIGSVTMPDLPGFGGMDSFYSIGKEPSLDNMADYLASVVKLKYKRKPFIIVGIGYGFSVATRMLEKYPEISHQVRLVISLLGYADQDDFVMNRTDRFRNLLLARLLKRRLPAYLARGLLLNERLLKSYYRSKLKAEADESSIDTISEDISLWQLNDFRTHMYSVNEMLTFTNCHGKVAVPVCHVGSNQDSLLDNGRIEQHLRVIFEDFAYFPVKNLAKALDYQAARRSVSTLIPPKLKTQMRRVRMQAKR